MYYKMDTLRIAVIGDQLFMYIPGQPPKHGYVENNPVQMETIKKFSPIKKEEFEDNIPCNTLQYVLFKALYLKIIGEKLKRIGEILSQ